jgi:hypothetical protein
MFYGGGRKEANSDWMDRLLNRPQALLKSPWVRVRFSMLFCTCHWLVLGESPVEALPIYMTYLQTLTSLVGQPFAPPREGQRIWHRGVRQYCPGIGFLPCQRPRDFTHRVVTLLPRLAEGDLKGQVGDPVNSCWRVAGNLLQCTYPLKY